MPVGARFIAVPAIAALALVLLASGCGGSSSRSTATPAKASVSAPTPVPTRTPVSIIANTLDDAIRLTAGVYTGNGNVMSIARPESVAYVETTVGQAEALFEPSLTGTPTIPVGSPVWAFVAYGAFATHCNACGPQTPIPSSTAWVFIVKGARYEYRDGYSNQQYDLSQLGTPVQLAPSQWNKY